MESVFNSGGREREKMNSLVELHNISPRMEETHVLDLGRNITPRGVNLKACLGNIIEAAGQGNKAAVHQAKRTQLANKSILYIFITVLFYYHNAFI